MSKLLRCLCAALFVACISLSNVGCAENTGGAQQSSCKQCPAGCMGSCCAKKEAKPCPPVCPRAQAQQQAAQQKAAQTDKQ